MKFLKYLLILIVSILILYFVGPRPERSQPVSPQIINLNISLDSLNDYVRNKDLEIPKLKPDNASRLVWVDSIRKTQYSLVYLHGFSASPMESDSVPFQFAKKYGMNLYAPLLAGHGRADIESFKDLQASELIESAKEAIAVGNLIGDQVIVMSCSTGSTLSIYLAAFNPELVDAMIMYSPNIALNDPTAKLITGPWGRSIVQMVVGDYYSYDGKYDQFVPFWTTTYSSRGLITLQELLETTMTPEVFQKIEQPYFIGYYYENDENQDHTISVNAIKSFDMETATPENKKRVLAFGEGGEHVLANPNKSKQSANVYKETIDYAKRILSLKAR